jgi:hypothetical protein
MVNTPMSRKKPGEDGVTKGAQALVTEMLEMKA